MLPDLLLHWFFEDSCFEISLTVKKFCVIFVANVISFSYNKEPLTWKTNLTKKGLHQRAVNRNLLNFSKQFFTKATFREKFWFFKEFMAFYKCFQQSYLDSYSDADLSKKWLFRWLIKILKIAETYLGKFPWWHIVFINYHNWNKCPTLTIFLKKLIFLRTELELNIPNWAK